ncbi:MAG: metalloregulator ArsR/SmtB family transcription factor [Chloroflexota bacterium]|nr:metalloregulator ArsR/SmtB family transcription factor [Chloroflexota bacterium]
MTLSPETNAERDLRRMRTLYRALGDETRLRVISLLAELGPMPVNELSARVVLSQPLISWHLRILRLAGLVETRRQGRERICRLQAATFGELHEIEARLIGGTSGIGVARSPSTAEVRDVG